MPDDIEEINLDESMAETLRDIQKGDEDEILDETEEDNGDLPETEDGDEKEGRERDDQGRFKKADDGAAEEDSAEEESEEDTELDQEGDIKEEDDPKLKRPPSTWNAEGKSKWNELPEWVKKQVLKREEDIGKGISQYKQKAEYADQINQVITPYVPLINAAGSNPIQTISSLLNTAYQLNTGTPQQKAQLLLETAKKYGADMSVFGQQEQETDPVQNQIQQYLDPITQELTQLRNTVQTQYQVLEQTRGEEIEQMIQDFKNAADENGNLKHIYFDDVEDDMALLISAARQARKSLSLEQAYDKAVWAREDIRSLIQSEQTKSEEAKRQAEAKKHADKAKKASSVNLGKKGSHEQKQPKPIGTIDDTIRETLENIQSRESI